MKYQMEGACPRTELLLSHGQLFPNLVREGLPTLPGVTSWRSGVEMPGTALVRPRQRDFSVSHCPNATTGSEFKSVGRLATFRAVWNAGGLKPKTGSLARGILPGISANECGER
jgi:hypothetical protein